jgi:hypothetical protein
LNNYYCKNQRKTVIPIVEMDELYKYVKKPKNSKTGRTYLDKQV